MSFLLRSARRIRHLPLLEKQDFIWDKLRKPFHKALSVNGAGVKVSVNGLAHIYMPPEFTSFDLSNYEKESTSALLDWLKDKESPLFVDIGSSIGVFSAVALSSNKSVKVIAIDSDLESIAAVHRICNGQSDRLIGICGFVSDQGNDANANTAAALTSTRMAEQHVRGGVNDTKYICIDGHAGDDIPFYTADNLFANIKEADVFIKIDVEGAEMKVLDGSKMFVKQHKPTFLISVHPAALSNYASSVAAIEHWLKEFDYAFKIIAVDHEEHWLCVPNQKATPGALS